jgi:hypothetical protein
MSNGKISLIRYIGEKHDNKRGFENPTKQNAKGTTTQPC